jgi:Na+-driven multidrug efflux pump
MISFVIAVSCFFFGGFIITLYNDDPEIVRVGSQILKMVALIQPLQSSQFILAGALRGAGDTKFVMVLMLVCAFLIWMPLLFIVNHFHPTMPALWATMIVYIIIISIATIARWKWGPWRKIKLI